MICLSRRTCSNIPFRSEHESHMLGYYNDYIERMTCYHMLSVHNMTHLEAPLADLFPNGLPATIYNKETRHETVIIDFNMTEKVKGKWLDLGRKDIILNTDQLQPEDLWAILNDLSISEVTLKNRIKELNIKPHHLQGKFLLFYTGWQRVFYPDISKHCHYNLNNPFLECLNMYLVHPYFNLGEGDIIKYIFETLGCAGFALDSASVEHPASHINLEACLPLAASLYRHAQKFGNVKPKQISNHFNKINLSSLKRQRRPLYFLKNLEFNKIDFPPRSNYIQGVMEIHPFELLTDHWGIVCEVFFEEKNETNLSEREQLFNDKIEKFNLSRLSSEIMPARGFMTPEKLILQDEEQTSSTVHIVPPHSTTHLDVYFNPEKEDWAAPYTNVIQLPALVIDCSDRIEKLYEYLTPSDEPFGLPIPLIDSNYQNPESLNNILSTLRIDKGELEGILFKEKQQFSGRFLIFHTGWDCFQSTRQSLNNRFLELRHAYLCHPFLSLEAAQYLADEGISGIASDVLVLENPIIYAQYEGCELTNSPLQGLLEYKEHCEYIEELHRYGDIPGRAILMKNKKNFYYMKRIRGMERLVNKQKTQRKVIHGTIYITPLTAILPRKKQEMFCHFSSPFKTVFDRRKGVSDRPQGTPDRRQDVYDRRQDAFGLQGTKFAIQKVVLGLTSEVVFIPEQIGDKFT